MLIIHVVIVVTIPLKDLPHGDHVKRRVVVSLTLLHHQSDTSV